MSITQRKARPLNRDSTSLRDTRIFIVACDDTYAPKQYFDFFSITRVQIHIVPTEDGTSSAQHVLNRLLQFTPDEDDELWMLLDTDHHTKGSHLKNFSVTISDAKRRGVNIALSKPCFEFWLLLHHVNESAGSSLKNATEAEVALRTQLGEYDKVNLKEKHWPLASVPEACKRAERLDMTVGGGVIPNGNTSRVYLLWKAIVAKSLPSQLPPELRELL